MRKGLTEEPLTTSNQHHICITHPYINVMTWFLKVLYRCHISFESWIEKSTVLGEPIRKSKDRVRDRLENVGLIVDKVSRANAKTGTSNDCKTARNFFSQTHVYVIVGCADMKYKDMISKIRKKLCTILRII